MPLPDSLNRGQPRTLAAALQALTEARRYAALLEAAAKPQKAAEQKLQAERAMLRDDLAKIKASLLATQDTLADERNENQRRLAVVQDERTKTHQRLVEAENSEQALKAQVMNLGDQAAGLSARLKLAETEATEKTSALERRNAEFTALRTLHTQHVERHAQEVGTLKTQASALSAIHDELKGQLSTLTRSRDELREQVTKARQTLAERDAELERHQGVFAAAKNSHQEAQTIAESLTRSLNAERAARIAAERRAEQLARDLADAQFQNNPIAGKREELLTTELFDIRLHRDTAVAESEALAARLLDIIAPQHYREHAEAAGYKPKEDPLYLLKRREVVVEDRYAKWQAAQGKRVRARSFDPEQTLVDQAYAATLSAKWKLKDHPHVRLKKRPPKWRIIGIWLDEESEEYLLEISQARIDEMERKMGTLG